MIDAPADPFAPDARLGDAALPDDPTLPEIRAAIAPRLAAEAAFDGWTPAALDAAAEGAGIDPALARLAFPGGAVDLIDAWFGALDAAMLADLPPERLSAMKVRQRVTALIEARLDHLAPRREALRRARGVLALPRNLPAAARLGWRTVDVMWRAAGDTATDYNHYTKRAMLGAVYAATTTIFVDDESAGHADTRAFLARRIDGVMAFEKWKAGAVARGRDRPSLVRFLGRLRYPDR